jgi:hypothetical protein
VIVVPGRGTNIPLAMTRRASFLSGAKCAISMGGVLLAVLATGCEPGHTPAVDSGLEGSRFYEGLRVKLEYGSLDGGRVRMGLFAEQTEAEVTGVDEDGMPVADRRPILLRVTPADGGRLSASVLDDEGKVDPSLDASRVTVSPTFSLSWRFEEFEVDLPSVASSESFSMIVWYDDDGDNALDLGLTEESEVARSFTCTHDGRTLVLSHLERDFYTPPEVVESDGDYVWQAWGMDAEGMKLVDIDWPDPWIGHLDARTEPPRD